MKPQSDVPTMSPDLTLGPVHLTVADLDRSIDFYERAIGLRLRQRTSNMAMLGAGENDLLGLHAVPGARPSQGYSGLFHFALLVPERADLARWLAHAVGDDVHLTGMADHFVSEAIYLDDPDGHGIEIYWDRPRAEWEGRVAERMTTLPLDIEDLLNELGGSAGFGGGEVDEVGAVDEVGVGEADSAEGGESQLGDGAFLAPTGTTMGHVHLRVSDIAASIAFYRDVLGFDLMATFGARAAFLSAGGYHHHIGANTWGSAGAGQAPDGVATLRHMTIRLPTSAEMDRVAERAAAAGHVGEAVDLEAISGEVDDLAAVDVGADAYDGIAGEAVDGGLLLRDPSGNGLHFVAES